MGNIKGYYDLWLAVLASALLPVNIVLKLDVYHLNVMEAEYFKLQTLLQA